MGVNYSFSGKVVDENGQPLGDNVEYCGLWYNNSIAKLSTEKRYTESDSSYNFNLGDPDWATQDGIVQVGHKIIIIAWSPKNSNRKDINSVQRFCCHEFSITSDTVYINDLQLKPIQSPNCQFSINQNIKVGETLIITPNIITSNFWFYKSKSMAQIASKYGVEIFPFINNIIIENKIEKDNILKRDWNIENTFEVLEPGNYTIFLRVKRNNEIVSSCSKDYGKIEYKPPIPGIFDLSRHIINSPLNFKGNILDINNTIKKITYKVSNGDIYENKEKDFSFSTIFNNKDNQYIKEEIIWNNGFEDKTLEWFYPIIFENRPPKILNFEIEKQNENEPCKYFSRIQAIDEDTNSNENLQYSWRIETQSDSDWFVLKEIGFQNENKTEIVFPISGNFVVTIKVKNSIGLISSEIRNIYNVVSCSSINVVEKVVEKIVPLYIERYVENPKTIFNPTFNKPLDLKLPLGSVKEIYNAIVRLNNEEYQQLISLLKIPEKIVEKVVEKKVPEYIKVEKVVEVIKEVVKYYEFGGTIEMKEFEELELKFEEDNNIKINIEEEEKIEIRLENNETQIEILEETEEIKEEDNNGVC